MAHLRCEKRISLANSAVEPGKAKPHTRLLIESAIILGLLACVFGLEWHKLSGDRDTPYMAVMIVPITATLVYLIVGALVPNLFAPHKIRWPLMLTLPIVFGALLQLCAALWLRGPNPLVKQEFFSLASHFWQRVQPVSCLVGFQVLVLTLWAVIAGRSKTDE